MLIRNWMDKDVDIYSIEPHASILKCRQFFRDLEISRLPVVDEKNRVVGLVSMEDIKRFLPVSGTHYAFIESMELMDKTAVAEVMVRNPVCCHDDETLESAAIKMIEKKVNALPIVNANEELVGVITEWDIFKALVSITGINQPGIQVSFEVQNKPGTLRSLLDIIKAHDLRIITVLSKIRVDNSRLLSIRCRGETEEQENKLIEDLKKEGTMRYWVRGTKTFIVNEQ